MKFKLFTIVGLALLCATPLSAQNKLNVIATTEDLAAIARD